MTTNPHLAIRVDGFRLLVENLQKNFGTQNHGVCFFAAFDLALPQLTRPRTLPKEVEPKKPFVGVRGEMILFGPAHVVPMGFYGVFWGGSGCIIV